MGTLRGSTLRRALHPIRSPSWYVARSTTTADCTGTIRLLSAPCRFIRFTDRAIFVETRGRPHSTTRGTIGCRPSPCSRAHRVEAARGELPECGRAEALRLLDARTVQKVVLARALEITLPTPVDPGWLVSALVERNPDAYTFAVPLGDCSAEHPHWFIGASPELLVRKRGLTVTSNPLAGSVRRGTSRGEDEANAQALMASKKDREEHEFVAAAVIRALKPFCRELHYPPAPSLIKTPTVWHLSTVISGELADPAISSLDLAMALHPTPAVCGHPTIAARQAIGDLEGFDRDLYAGFVGWCDAGGDGEWAVSIRCGELGIVGCVYLPAQESSLQTGGGARGNDRKAAHDAQRDQRRIPLTGSETKFG